MRKLIVSLVIGLIYSSVSAQFEQGVMIVGGDLGLEFDNRSEAGNTVSTNGGKYRAITLEPKFGYFVINNLAVGAELGFGLESYQPDGDERKNNSNTISIGPFAQYYFSAGVFLEGKYSFGTTKHQYRIPWDFESKATLTGWSLGAGYALFLNDNVALEPMIGFQSTVAKGKTRTPEMRYEANGFFFRVGFQVYLR